MTTASPTKLRDGSWGARVPGGARQGQTIRIQTRAGKSWTATIGRVLWTGPDRQTGQTVSLCSTRSLDRPARRRGGCGCDCMDCSPRCQCDAHCVCRGGNIYDC